MIRKGPGNGILTSRESRKEGELLFRVIGVGPGKLLSYTYHIRLLLALSVSEGPSGHTLHVCSSGEESAFAC
jgi:hypothetical protein